jgi:hypothetical protein
MAQAVRKRKASNRKEKLICQELGDNKVSYWARMGTLPKVTTFRFNSNRSPADSLHARVRKLCPEVQSVSDIAVSPRTNEYLRRELTKYARKHTFYRGRRLESAVAFTMLNTSPCDLEGAEDFVLYVKLKQVEEV